MTIRFYLILLFAFPLSIQAQNHKLNIRLSPNTNIARVVDPDPRPSSVHTVADGHTTKESNVGGVSIGANLDYQISDFIYLSSGLWFTSKNLHIRNTDGSYSGVSRYNTLYMQIPLLVKAVSNEITDNIRLGITAGPTIDFKLNEQLDGGDGAHYWNLANNNYHLDPTRGRNGNMRPMPLFNPMDLGLFFSIGPEFQLGDNFILYSALSYWVGGFNMINPNLLFNDPMRTPVSESVSIRSRIIGLDLGVKF
ncbi:MAG: outer membrane beta-barrel protein [Cytophagaceae bacterium]